MNQSNRMQELDQIEKNRLLSQSVEGTRDFGVTFGMP